MEENKLWNPEDEMEPLEDAVEEAQESPAMDLAALRAELEAALDEKLGKLMDDALRLASMTDEERAGFEACRRESALDEREKAIAARELRAEALELLAARGLPKALADALGYESRPAMLAAVDGVERAFRAAVQAAVEQRLRGESPAAGASSQSDDALLDDASYFWRR